jgi:hypothetical protein
VLAIATRALAIATRSATTTTATTTTTRLAREAATEIANSGIHLARYTTTQALNAIEPLANNALRGICDRAY